MLNLSNKLLIQNDKVRKRDDSCKIISSKSNESEFSKISDCCRKTARYITKLVFSNKARTKYCNGINHKETPDHIHIIFKDISIVNPKGFQMH